MFVESPSVSETDNALLEIHPMNCCLTEKIAAVTRVSVVFGGLLLQREHNCDNEDRSFHSLKAAFD